MFQLNANEKVEYNDFFAELGYSSMNILENIGSMIIILLIIILITLLTKASNLVTIYSNKYFFFQHHSRLIKLRGYISQRVIYSMIITLLILSFLDLLICSILNAIDFGNKGSSHYKSVGRTSGLTISIITLITCIPGPLIIFAFLKMKDKTLREPRIKTVYGSLYNQIDTVKNPYYSVLYLMRRMLFALSAILLTGMPAQQLLLTVIGTLLMISFIKTVQPFQEEVLKWVELMNESTIYFLCIFYLAFTDLVESDILKIAMGWLCTGTILVNLFANISLLIIKFLKHCYDLIKKYKAKSQKVGTKENILAVTTGIALIEMIETFKKMDKGQKLEIIEEEKVESEGHNDLILKSNVREFSKTNTKSKQIGVMQGLAQAQEIGDQEMEYVEAEKKEWETEEVEEEKKMGREIDRWSQHELQSHDKINFKQKEEDIGFSSKNEDLWEGELNF